jgi:TRAP-type C4-dicarboxylate transport system permease large subunit
MGASVALGGVVERSEMMSVVPASLGSPWIAMTLLVIVMVLVGMTMDAFGAVVLVSITLAKIAYDNGIDPVHFWMMVLVGFELGYLTPPVALNQLLARQAVGAAADVDRTDPRTGFFARYSHVLVPSGVMGATLLIVAYVPLLFY